MSDNEDNESLIEEIKALESVLEPKQNLQVKTLNDSDQDGQALTELETSFKDTYIDDVKNVKNINCYNVKSNEYEVIEDDEDMLGNMDDIEYCDNDSDDDETDNESLYRELREKYECKDLQDLLELNKVLIESLESARNKMEQLLATCNAKQREVENKLSKQMSSYHSKIVSFNAGMPYFKDRNYYTPPPNEDTETKIRNGELRMTELQRINRWTQQDKSNLLKVIKHEVTLSILKKTEEEKPLFDSSITKTSQLPTDVRKAIGPLGSIKFDWMKIAANMPDNRHTAEECEVMWNVFLHPDINKQKWTPKEDKQLIAIAEKFKFQDWDAIAKELNTQRSGYQCFIRFNTKNWKNLMKGQSWQPEDDEMLIYLINKLQIGDYIPWGYIASCMKKWTKQQVYFRWNYSLAPNLKKGRFSPEEDKQLLDAVKKYGLNFSKISALIMTQRTNIQLKEHYQTLMHKNNQKRHKWTKREDVKLIKLHEKYGPNWAKIVKEMPNFTRIQARQRYLTLAREEQRRTDDSKPAYHQTTVVCTLNAPWSNENEEILIKHLKIDDQIVQFFKKEKKSTSSEELRKSYHPQRLKEDTKKLYQILTMLNVDLDKTDFVDDEFEFHLNEKSLQLISSLKQYSERRKIKFNESIEQIRNLMFGPEQSSIKKNRFIPPLPFTFYNPRKKIIINNTIDYSIDTTQNHQLELVLKLIPSAQVNEKLGEDVENIFEKLKEIIVGNLMKTDKTYKIKCKPFAKSIFFFGKEEISTSESNNAFENPTEEHQVSYNWERGKLISKTFTTETNNLDRVLPQTIEPNRTILQAYQEILLITQNIPSEESDDSASNFMISKRGYEALSLFKRRFEQLFNIPTALSRIIPPDVLDESAFLPSLEKLEKKRQKPKKKKTA